VWDKELRKIQDRVRNGKVVVTIHAEEEMDNDALSLDDVENAILEGTIAERQEDLVTKGWKYVIQGKDLAGGSVEVVAKIGGTGKAVIITVYRT
jgi:hypothetical protein